MITNIVAMPFEDCMMFWKLIITSLFISGITTLVNIRGRNLIILVLSYEVLFFALIVACIAHHYANQGGNWNNDALFYAIAITVLAAAESALGLALIARINKHKKNIRIKKM